MPIDFQIDRERKLVIARGRGTLTNQEILTYQREVWSCPDLAGFNDLVDMTDVERIEGVSIEGVTQLARLSAAMDARAPASKFAIVAPRDLAFGLGRMYQVHRNLEECGTKQVGVYRTRAEALAFLDVQPESPTP